MIMGLCFGKKEDHRLYCNNCGCVIEYDIYLSGDVDIACSQLCQCKLNKKNDIKIYAPL